MKQNILQKILPLGTRRRRVVDMFYQSFKIIYREGLRQFFRLSLNRLKTGRFSDKTIKTTLVTEFSPLAFPVFSNINVSIIIPVYNQPVFTYNCLLSVLDKTSDVNYEVVLVDNASDNETVNMLKKVSNIEIVRNEENTGFVIACNQGAEKARGEYILFLNNDIQVEKEWLTALLDVFKKELEAGAVGSKLIYPNGVLQEAGGIVWRDGVVWNYGKFDDPEKPQYSYLREVDYCSAACLMVRKEIFEKIGGFDKRYVPAYCEDTDLCFEIRKLGYKVYLQPTSRVIHFEGITAGKKVYKGVKKYQVVNYEKFKEKWSDVLARQPVSEDDYKAFLARDRKAGRRILIIDHYVPKYDQDAGSYWMFCFARDLSRSGYRVLFWPDNLYAEQPYTEDLQQLGIEVLYGFQRFDRFLKDYGRFIDIVVLTRQHIAIKYIDMVKRYVEHAKVVYRMPDLEYLREKRKAELEGKKELLKASREVYEREFYLFDRSDVVIAISKEEKDMLLAERPGKRIEIIPHPMDKITPVSKSFEERKDLLFVGSMHPPNEDAILYYSQDIFPLIQKKLQNIKLYAVGSNPSKRLQDMKHESIIITGFVKELFPYFDKCRVYAAPLRYGAGVKGKIVEAMSFGLPIVTTSIGAEGLNLKHGENVLIADSGEDFADSIVQLYNDKDLWMKLSLNSQKFVESRFSQETFFQLIKNMMEDI